MSIPPAWRDYKPLTTTMLTLEDLERMSSSAVSSGESSHPRICWRLWNSRMARRLGDQSPSTTSSAPPRATNLPRCPRRYPSHAQGTVHRGSDPLSPRRLLHMPAYLCAPFEFSRRSSGTKPPALRRAAGRETIPLYYAPSIYGRVFRWKGGGQLGEFAERSQLHSVGLPQRYTPHLGRERRRRFQPNNGCR